MAQTYAFAICIRLLFLLCSITVFITGQDHVNIVQSRNSSPETLGDSGGSLTGDVAEVISRRRSGRCVSGHIQSYNGHCVGSERCLRMLVGLASPLYRSDTTTAEEVRDLIHDMPGIMDDSQVLLLTQLTTVQWAHGVYGAVGDVSTSESKFALVLAGNLNSEAGERLFVSNTLVAAAASTQSMFSLAQLDALQVYLAEHRSRKPSAVDPLLYTHHGTIDELNRHSIEQWDLPQFRFIAIDGSSDAATILHSLEKSACMLRDGGIITISDDGRASMRLALNRFFRLHGVGALTPLLRLGNMLYMCTSNWKHKYTKHIQNDMEMLLAYDFREVTTDVFGRQFSYLEFDS